MKRRWSARQRGVAWAVILLAAAFAAPPATQWLDRTAFQAHQIGEAARLSGGRKTTLEDRLAELVPIPGGAEVLAVTDWGDGQSGIVQMLATGERSDVARDYAAQAESMGWTFLGYDSGLGQATFSRSGTPQFMAVLFGAREDDSVSVIVSVQ